MQKKPVQQINNNCTLVVDGRDITDTCYVHYNEDQRYAELPLLAIAKALGAKVKWKNENVALIKTVRKGKVYTLDIQAKTLCEDAVFDVFIPAPSSTVLCSYYREDYQEYMIDHLTITTFLINGFGARTVLDHNNRTVEIRTGETGDA